MNSEFWVNDFQHYKTDFEKALLPYLERKNDPLYSDGEARIMAEAENYLISRYGFSFVAVPEQEYAGREEVNWKHGKPLPKGGSLLLSGVKVYIKYSCHFYKESIGTVMLTSEASKQLLEGKARSYIDKLIENTVIDQIADGIARLICNVDTHGYRDSHYIEVKPDRVVCGEASYDDEYEDVRFSSISIHRGKSYGPDTF